MTHTYTHSRSIRARGPWLALTALTLLLGCGAHDADVAPASMDNAATEPTDAVGAEPSSAPGLDDTALLGVGDSTLSAADRARAAEPAAPDAVATTNHIGGERIAARTLLTSDGQLTALGWHDSELNEDCSFQRDDQGTLRCFPLSGTERVYYSNASCTRGFVDVKESAEGTEAVHYYYYQKDTACGEGIRAYELGERMDVPETTYARNSRGQCVEVTATGTAFRALGAPVDPASFVAAEYGVIDSSSRIKGYGLIAEDGAVNVTGFVDSELNTPCMWTGSDTTVCAPSGSVIDRFADPEMSVPLIRDEVANCDEPMATMGTRYDTATGVAHYYQRDGRFEGDTVYGMVPQVISGPAAIPVRESYYQAEEVSAARLAQGTVQSDESSRLNPVFWKTAEGDSWFSHWYDLALGSTCAFMADASGGALCLPNTTGSRVVYADAACGLPVAEVDANCGEERPQFAVQHVNGETDAEVNVRRLMTATQLPAVYEATDAGCELRGARADKHYFGLSAPLPAAAFVSAKPVSVVENPDVAEPGLASETGGPSVR
ncbi:MAG TPA: hypothetical protein VHO25_18270 [Polyangiaceae bacterium]|nr:hypothetical protein [Polyangiaceae bacterium]